MTTPRPCKSPRCRNRSWRKDGWCTKHAEAYGHRKPNQPAQNTINDLHTLYTAGWTQAQIADTTGITTSTQYNLLHGKNTWVRHTTATAIHNLIGTPPRGGVKIPAWPYQRRLQALQAAGHTGLKLAKTSGISHALISKISLGKQDTLTQPIADKITELWDTLHNQPIAGQPTRTAKRLRWSPPMGWDNIDNPDEQHPPLRFKITVDNGQRELAAKILTHYAVKPWPTRNITRKRIRDIADGTETSIPIATSNFIYKHGEYATNGLRHRPGKEQHNAAA